MSQARASFNMTPTGKFSREPDSAFDLDVFQKTKLCRFYKSNMCVKGTECNFAHSFGDLRPLPDYYRTKLCKVMLQEGKCDREKCGYAHCKAELRRVAHYKHNQGGDAQIKGEAAHHGQHPTNPPVRRQAANRAEPTEHGSVVDLHRSPACHGQSTSNLPSHTSKGFFAYSVWKTEGYLNQIRDIACTDLNSAWSFEGAMEEGCNRIDMEQPKGTGLSHQWLDQLHSSVPWLNQRQWVPRAEQSSLFQEVPAKVLPSGLWVDAGRGIETEPMPTIQEPEKVSLLSPDSSLGFSNECMANFEVSYISL